MIENLIVALIVGASAWHIGLRYLRPKAAKAGCGSGCDSCKGCATPAVAEPAARRVIKIHSASPPR